MSHILSDRLQLKQIVRENSGPQINSPDYNCHFQPEEGRFGTSTEGCGETPLVAPIQLPHTLNHIDPFLKHIGIGELKREEEFITLNFL